MDLCLAGSQTCDGFVQVLLGIMLLIFFPIPIMSSKNNENFIFEARIR